MLNIIHHICNMFIPLIAKTDSALINEYENTGHAKA